MTLLITDEDVRKAVNMAEMVQAIENAFREEKEGSILQPERLNLVTENMLFRLMPAILPHNNIMGFKAFHGSKTGGWRYLVAVYDATEGSLQAIMDAHYLTAIRTGAAAGVATRYLARPDAQTVAVFGSGLEARTNLEAVCVVRQIKKVKVYSPRKERREQFADEMGNQLGISVEPVSLPEQAARGAEIVVVATNTSSSGGGFAFQGKWIEPGMHINSIGSTMPSLREIDVETFLRSNLIVIDAPHEQVQRESGDVIDAVKQGAFNSSQVIRLKDMLSYNPEKDRKLEAVTLYKSVGEALQDISAGTAIYHSAVKRDIGIDLGEFLQRKQLG